MHDAEVIEISSHSSSSPLSDTMALTSLRIPYTRIPKEKAKMKDIEVIELTDDDDDDSDIGILEYTPRKRRRVINLDVDSESDVVSQPGPSRVQGVPTNRVRTTHSLGIVPHENLVAAPTISGGVTRVVNGKGKGKEKEEQVFPRKRANTNEQTSIPGPSTPDSPAQVDIMLLSPLDSPGPHARLPATESPPPVPLSPPSLPQESPEETMSHYVAQVLEIIPDVDPEHCATLVADHFQAAKDTTVERVLHVLFEDPSYPRATRIQGKDKGKKRATDSDEGEVNRSGKPRKKVKLGAKGKERDKKEEEEDELWLNIDKPFTGGKDYHELALNQLQQDYPYTPKVYLREQLGAHKGFYAPTFFSLRRLEQQIRDRTNLLPGYPYERRKTPYKPSRTKGKQRALEDREFERELAWVRKKVTVEETKQDGEKQEKETDEHSTDTDEEDDLQSESEPESESDGEDEENGIECGCCFSKFRFEKMIQCPDAHLFCRSCLRAYASTLLGTHNPNITCMSQSTCTHLFPPSQLQRVLPRKTYALYERLVQANEIAAANLEGLEECPFCEWKAVFDVGFDGEKLFRCGGCGSVSCRKCKKVDHLPKRCEEVEEDRKLDARHQVEEAMTQALMRNCPKCSKAFIKESGCNKMLCPNCRTLSCYICRKIITGYDHFNFNQQPGHPTTSAGGGKCVLWDKDLDAMHANEVKKAADKAIAQVQLSHPDVSISDLKVQVDKPKQVTYRRSVTPPPPRPPPPPPRPHPPPPRRPQRRQDPQRNVAGRIDLGFNFNFGVDVVPVRVEPGPAPGVVPVPGWGGLEAEGRGVHEVGGRGRGRGRGGRGRGRDAGGGNGRGGRGAAGVNGRGRGGRRDIRVLYPPPAVPPVGVVQNLQEVPNFQQPLPQPQPELRNHPNPQQQPQPHGPPPPPYHEAVAQAMRGQYQPAGGGVEVGGRVLRARARPGRGVGPGEPEGGGRQPRDDERGMREEAVMRGMEMERAGERERPMRLRMLRQQEQQDQQDAQQGRVERYPPAALDGHLPPLPRPEQHLDRIMALLDQVQEQTQGLLEAVPLGQVQAGPARLEQVAQQQDQERYEEGRAGRKRRR